MQLGFSLKEKKIFFRELHFEARMEPVIHSRLVLWIRNNTVGTLQCLACIAQMRLVRTATSMA